MPRSGATDRLTWQPNMDGGKVVRCHGRLKAAGDTAVAAGTVPPRRITAQVSRSLSLSRQPWCLGSATGCRPGLC